MGDKNPQAKEMADESMVRNLKAQAEAIWPQEKEIFLRHPIPTSPKILDVACGTGEISLRLLELFSQSSLLGIDIETAHLQKAQSRCAKFGERAQFDSRDAYATHLPHHSFDLVVCRHMLQAVPEPHKVIDEMLRVLKPGGTIHLLVEDYSLMLFHPTQKNADDFWQQGVMKFAQNTGTDLRIGRKTPALLLERGCQNIRAEYVVLDTLRVPRQTFADIWTAWRDGYTDIIAKHSGMSRDAVWDYWNDMISAILDPQGYGVWLVPVVTGQKSQ